MKFIATLKHWQLFLFFVLITTLENALIGTLAHTAIFFPLLWAFALGYYGQQQVALLGLKRLKTALLFFNACLIAMVIVVARIHANLWGPVAYVFDQVLPALVLLAVIAGLFTLLLAAKTLARIEYRSEVSFIEYLDNFLYLAIPIVGIWVLQPKINRIVRGEHAIV